MFFKSVMAGVGSPIRSEWTKSAFSADFAAMMIPHHQGDAREHSLMLQHRAHRPEAAAHPCCTVQPMRRKIFVPERKY